MQWLLFMVSFHVVIFRLCLLLNCSYFFLYLRSIGRFYSFYIGVATLFVSSLSVTFMPNFWSYTVMRTLVAISNMGCFLLAFIIGEYALLIQLTTWQHTFYFVLSFACHRRPRHFWRLPNWRRIDVMIIISISMSLTYFWEERKSVRS